MLNGEAEILIAKGADPDGARIKRLVAGSFVYYPAYQYHTIRNSSFDSPVTYLYVQVAGAAGRSSYPPPNEHL